MPSGSTRFSYLRRKLWEVDMKYDHRWHKFWVGRKGRHSFLDREKSRVEEWLEKKGGV